MPTTDPAIDVEMLKRRTLGNTLLMNELLTLFRAEAVAAAGRLRTAIGANDTDTQRRVAHRLKGSAATIGATPFAALLAAVEDACVQGRPIAGDLPAIEAEADRCVAAIDTLLNAGT